MASISGLQNNPTNNLNTIDGLQIINATSIYDNGVLVDTTNLVPYTGATQTIDAGAQAIKTAYAPIASNDVVNLTTLQNAVAYINGIASLNFVPFTGATSNTNLGTYGLNAGNITANSSLTVNGAATMNSTLNVVNTITAPTAKFTTITSATPSLALGIDASGNLNSFPVPSSANFPFGGTTNINGALKTILEPMKYNPSLDAYSLTAVAPSTYTLVSGNWRIVNSSATVSEIQFPSQFVFQPYVKYLITFTNILCGSGTYSGTVYNTSTATTVSDAPIAITTSSQTLTMTFTTSLAGATVNLRFTGTANVYVQYTNFTIQQASTELIGNVIVDSEIESNIVQSVGKTANLAGGLLVNQTSTGVSAATFTTASLPAGAPASALSGTYTLAPNPTTGASFAMWLGATTFIPGAKYNFTFTGMSGTQTNQQIIYMYIYSYSGGFSTNIGDTYYYWVPSTPGTITGSFTATSNSIVFQFQASVVSKTVSFSTFTLTRADTQLTGITTVPTNAGTPAYTLGINSSNQLVSYANPTGVFSGSVSSGYVPYASSTNTLANSLITQTGNSILYNNFSVSPSSDVGYTGASFTAGTGIGSITYSAPTYTANSSASYQGVINLPALSTAYLNLPCLATFTNLTFPLYTLSPYPYFTLTCGSTVVYTSAIGASGIITIPFTPTSTTLFITIYFKTPPSVFTGPVFTWNTFSMAVYTSTMNGKALTGTTNSLNLPSIFQASSSPLFSSANSFGGSSPLYPAQICALHPGGQALYLGSFYTSGVNQCSTIQSSSVYSNADHTSTLCLNPGGGFVGVGTVQPTGNFDVNGLIRMGNYSGGSYDNIQFQRGTGANDYPNINCQDNFFGLYTSTAGGWCGDSQVGDMVMRPSNGKSFRVGIYGGNAAFTVYSDNNVGVGLATPTSKLTIQGNTKIQGISATNIGDNTGGHLLHYTNSDSYAYPTISHFNYNHSNMALLMDMYYQGGWKSSTTGTGYAIYKQGDYLSTYYGTSGAAGGSMSLNLAHEISNTGVNRFPNQPYTFLGQGGSSGSVAYGVGAAFGYSGYAGYLTPYQQIGFTNTPGNGWVSYYGTFTAPWQGRYQVDITFYWNSYVAGNRWAINIYNSSGTLYYSKYCCIEGAGIAADTVRPYGTTLLMSAGDYFQIKQGSGSGTCNAYYGGETHSSMTVAFLG
jgi:hypothetical protein